MAERRSALTGLKVGLGERENYHLAGYRLAHAASSSGVFQSLARADSLKSRPLNDSSSFFCRKKRAKSETSRCNGSGIAAYCQSRNKVPLGFVEGFNNKIRVLQRRAYGLRDEEYLRLKILTCMLPQI